MTDVIKQANELLIEGKVAPAISTLQYAQRKEPSSRSIALALGVARLAAGDPRASEPLELLTSRDDLAEAWLELARTRDRFGDKERAASELHMLLSRHVSTMTVTAAEFIDRITRETGAQGWCAIVDGRKGLLRIGGGVGNALFAGTAKLTLKDRNGQPVAFAPMFKRNGRGTLCRLMDPHLNGDLQVVIDGKPLLGSPIDLTRLHRAEGFVDVDHSGGLHGWCWYPADVERLPMIVVRNRANPKKKITVTAKQIRADSPSDVRVRHRGFHIEREEIAGIGPGPLEVAILDGNPLYGSPLDPGAEQTSVAVATRSIGRIFSVAGQAVDEKRTPVECWSGAPADILGVPPGYKQPPRDRGVDIIIPVYRGEDVTIACIESVQRHAISEQRIVVLVDASPEPRLVEYLKKLGNLNEIDLHIETVNKGFTATMNRGLRMSEGRDVVLLNSDTVVTPGWLEQLREVVHSSRDIGTATPLSNDATIFSYPSMDRANPMLRADQLRALAEAAKANSGMVVDVPTGHGFCMYVRAECLADTGLLREDLFAQGYGEENDFCIRARHLGWRSVAVPSVYIAHVGSQSFGAAKNDLITRNARILNRLHFGYDALIQRWLDKDPLWEARRSIDMERFRLSHRGRPSTLLISHDRGGGVKRHVLERAAAYEKAGARALILTPTRGTNGRHLCNVEAFDESFPNMNFAIPEENAAFFDFLKQANAAAIDIHHTIGHNWALFDLPSALDLTYNVYIHDYSWFCPRITLTGEGGRYCGEPDLNGCNTCVADHGSNLDEEIMPTALIGRSSQLLRGAKTVIAPSKDAARRIERRFDVSVTVQPWENLPEWRSRPTPWSQERPLRVAVIGAIGLEKGYRLLLSCARTIARHGLPIEFCVVGFTCDDQRLLDTGVVQITGRYEEHEALDLIREQQADFAFLPALWPETWSYVLTQAWIAGLNVLAFDIGAPAERIRQAGRGMLLPLGISENRLLQVMLSPTLFAQS